uniref:Uncharacterized protein n=1 Tax=Oryza brachyantha TaxID=4533 RepID=J3M2H6_ORYBR
MRSVLKMRQRLSGGTEAEIAERLHAASSPLLADCMSSMSSRGVQLSERALQSLHAQWAVLALHNSKISPSIQLSCTIA